MDVDPVSVQVKVRSWVGKNYNVALGHCHLKMGYTRKHLNPSTVLEKNAKQRALNVQLIDVMGVHTQWTKILCFQLFLEGNGNVLLSAKNKPTVFVTMCSPRPEFYP